MKRTGQLNILEVMGYRRAHHHKSIDSIVANDISLPTVESNGQYDSPTITRVTKQFAENIQRITEYIKDNADALKTTNLASFITTNTSDEDGMNKIFVSAPCTMTSQRTLNLKNCMDIQVDAATPIPSLIKTFMIEDAYSKKQFLIGVSNQKYTDSSGKDHYTPQIIKIELPRDTQNKTIPICKIVYDPLTIAENDSTRADDIECNLQFKSADFADANHLYIYVITNLDIRIFKVSDICSLDSITFCNIVDFKHSYKPDSFRFNDNIIVEDIFRNNKIIDAIVGDKFDEFVDKYFKLGDFPTNVLREEYFSLNPVIVYDVGLVTGKYGLSQIHCFSSKPKNINEFEVDNGIGSLHIRCIDNKPIKDAFFYDDNGQKYLIAIHGWPVSAMTDEDVYADLDSKYKGISVYKINEAAAASTSYKVDPDTVHGLDEDDWQPVPKNGILVYEKYGDDAINNINIVLESRGVNGGYVNNLSYSTKYNYGNIEGFIIKYEEPYYKDREPYYGYWFVELGDLKLCTIEKVYDKHEFNCLKEYKINRAAYSVGSNVILFDIEGVGLIEGTKEYDKSDNVGFRFRVIKRADSFLPDEKITDICVMNRCFVAISKNKIYFVISNGDCNELRVGTDINTSVKEIQLSCTYDKSNILCIGMNTKNEECKLATLFLKYQLNTKQYSELITDRISDTIIGDFLSKDNAVGQTIDKHISSMHTQDTIITKLNTLLFNMENRSIMQSTGLSDNLRISQIILNYPNHGDDFAYTETDENSTNIFGRINSMTVNSNPTLTTIMRRNSNAITYYDTIQDENGNEILNTNKVTYSICRLSPLMSRITINVPSTGTYYVDNILGWSGGSRTGSALMRKNLGGGYIQSQIENCTTRYQLVLNRVFFDIKNIINVTAQLTSAPLKIYSNTNEFDIRHYGMYDSPAIAPLNMNSLTDSFDYDLSGITNDEVALTFSIFGGDAIQINVLIENYNEE